MSTSTQATLDVATLDKQLNDLILKGDILEAFDRFYAENVVMQENSDEPIAGKATNRKREEDFLASVEQIHGVEVVSSAVNGDVTFSEWKFDATYKGGVRVNLAQVAVRRWKNGQIVRERFYYNKG
jgi:ketosteroid isomerase-like protein